MKFLAVFLLFLAHACLATSKTGVKYVEDETGALPEGKVEK